MSKKQNDINSLIQEIVIPFEQYMLCDDIVGKKLKENIQARVKYNKDVAKFSIKLLNDLVGAKELLESIVKDHLELSVSQEDMRRHIFVYFALYQAWVDRYYKTDIYYNELLQRFRKIFIDTYERQKNADVESQNYFTVIENEEIDEIIEDMHYQEDEKISAKEFLTSYPLDEIDTEDIIIVRDMFIELLDDFVSYNENFTNRFVDILQKLNTVLEFTFSTKEFKDIGMALNKLLLTLEKHKDFNSLQLSQFYIILVSMIEDLIKWLETIFIKQDALDIHYFDASLLANIAQFSMMVQDESDKKDLDDDFLF